MKQKQILFFTWLLMIAMLGHVFISASEFLVFLLKHNAKLYIVLYILWDISLLITMTVLYYKAILKKENEDR
ncbi:hypothetical protein [Chryseobacterium foetidum]|uniref:hypothetical protein n=1 Tax=Chryseobacterium foetidum TaxID=2951057 RepID=UPI0021C797EE|nr:hypothetical protein [Chryseobacterium foetidum]